MRRKGWKFPAVFALFASVGGCADGPSGPGALETSEFSHEEARAQSLNLARRDGYGLVRAPELERYLTSQTRRILEVAGRPELDIEVRVAAAVDFNASSHADGLIRVSVGMLDALQSEDEIVFWLAHEVAHVVQGHHTKDMLFDWQEQAAAAVGFLNAAEIMGRSIKSGLVEEGYDGRSELDAWHKQAARIAFLSTAIISPSWTRQQEKEADFLAFDWMTKLGYQPDRALCAMDRLRDWEGEHGVEYFKTLELMTTEYAEAALQRARDRLIGRQYGDLAFTAAGQGIVTFKGWIVQTVSDLSSEHFGAGVRYRDLQAHWREQEMAGGPGPGPGPGSGPGPGPGAGDDTGRASAEPCSAKRDSWTQFARGGSVGRMLANYAKARDALRALSADDDPDAAAELAQGTLTGVTADHALPRLVMAQIRSAQQLEDEERANLTKAFDTGEPALRPYIRLAEFHEREDEVAAALRTAKEGFTRFGDAPEVLPYLIRLNAKAGNGLEAKRLFLTCQLNHAAFLDLCEEAAAEGLNSLPHESGSAALILAAMKGIDEDSAKAQLAAHAQEVSAARAAADGKPEVEPQEAIQKLACSAQQAVGSMMSSLSGLWGESDTTSAPAATDCAP